jgi:Sir2 family
MVISGAGVSVSCGIPDFRSKDGLYDRIEARFALPDPQCLFSLDYLKDDPEPFFEFAKVRSLIHFLSNSRTLELSNSRTLFPSFFLCFSPSFFPLSVCLCFPVFHILLAYVLSLSIYVSTALSLSLFVPLCVSVCVCLSCACLSLSLLFCSGRTKIHIHIHTLRSSIPLERCFLRGRTRSSNFWKAKEGCCATLRRTSTDWRVCVVSRVSPTAMDRCPHCTVCGAIGR